MAVFLVKIDVFCESLKKRVFVLAGRGKRSFVDFGGVLGDLAKKGPKMGQIPLTRLYQIAHQIIQYLRCPPAHSIRTPCPYAPTHPLPAIFPH